MKKILLILTAFVVIYSCTDEGGTAKKESLSDSITRITSTDTDGACPPGVAIPDALHITDSRIGDAMSEYFMSSSVDKQSAAWDINVGYLRYLIKSMSDDASLRFFLVAIREDDMTRRTVIQPERAAEQQVNSPTLLVIDPSAYRPIEYDIARRICPPPPDPACKFPPIPKDSTDAD